MSFFDVKIDEVNKTFCIVESDKKPHSRNSAVETLNNINRVINNNYSYLNPENLDKYSGYSKSKFFQLFKEKSEDITQRYHKKYAKLDGFTKLFFKEKTLKNYFDIVMEKGQFHIVASLTKPKSIYNDSAVLAINRIAYVIENKVQIRQDDYFSEQYGNNLNGFLKNKCDEIEAGYISKLGCFPNSKKSKIQIAKARVENLISPPRLLDIVTEDPLKVIAKYLKIKELAPFSRVNKHGNEQKVNMFNEQALKYNYQGPIKDAEKFLKELYDEIDLFKREFGYSFYGFFELSSRYSSEFVLNQLTHLNSENLFKLLSLPKIYDPKFKKILNLVNTNFESKPLSANTIKLRDRALFYTTQHNEPRLVEMLLKAKADPNNSNEPLFYAVENGFLEVTKLLHEHGATIDIKSKIQNQTPLSLACGGSLSDSYKFNLDLVKYLLENGAKIDETPSPLLIALNSNKINAQELESLVKCLLEYKCDPNVPDSHSNYPLHIAANRKPTPEIRSVVLLLLDAGANINEADSQGNTPFSMLSCYVPETDGELNDHINFLKLLIKKYKADVRVRDILGDSLLTLITKAGKIGSTEKINSNRRKMQNMFMAFGAEF